jgi:hypothetical protein
MIKAERSFEPERKVPFGPWAWQQILGHRRRQGA